jgi:uncharacterized protein (UPF0276 family)
MPTHGLPALGAGIGFRPALQGALFLERHRVNFLEIVTDHYIDALPSKLEELTRLAAHFPLIPHGLNLSLGSAEGLDLAYLDRVAAVVDRVRPPWWSEHIAFSRAGGVDIGHLAPLPWAEESIEALCRNIATVKERIKTPLILENITYSLVLPGSEMTEAQFLTEVLERTDCGLLLDVTNLYTNSVNFGFDARAFLDTIPLDRVVQLHFTGGYWHDSVLVDSHSERTPEAVWVLLDEVVRRAPVRGVILERDENLPAFRELAAELSRAREIGRRHGRWR